MTCLLLAYSCIASWFGDPWEWCFADFQAGWFSQFLMPQWPFYYRDSTAKRFSVTPQSRQAPFYIMQDKHFRWLWMLFKNTLSGICKTMSLAQVINALSWLTSSICGVHRWREAKLHFWYVSPLSLPLSYCGKSKGMTGTKFVVKDIDRM